MTDINSGMIRQIAAALEPLSQAHADAALILRAFADQYDCLRVELASWRRTCEKITEERDEANRLLDEARKQEPAAYQYRVSDGGWGGWVECSKKMQEAAEQFNKDYPHLPPYIFRKLYAAPVPAQPAVPDDVAKDAARYRWMRADGPNTYMTLKETAHLIGDAYDAAIDAAVLSATDSEGRKDE